MRITKRFAARAAASSMLVAATLGAIGVQAAGAASAATPKKAASTVTCTTANTKLTVTEAPRPVNHLLLKVTNTGTRTCNAFNAPVLRAGQDAQAPVRILEESRPQAVMTLAPGESAYAGIGTYTPDGEGGYVVEDLGVFLSGKSLYSTSGPEKSVKLPNGGVFFNSSAFVTFWQDNPADALFW